MREDCYANRNGVACSILCENVCEKQGGHCAFFATREEVEASRRRASELLLAHGLYPKVKTVVVNGVKTDIQSTGEFNKK